MMEGRYKGVVPRLTRIGLLGSVWRFRKMFVVVFLGILLLFVAASFVIPARYLATGLVIVAEDDPATRTADVWAQKQGDPADLESQIMILRSIRLTKLALSQPGALQSVEEVCRGINGGCANLTADSAELAEKVAERYSVSAVGRSRVISISYTSAKSKNAMNMANALVTAYLEDQKGSESGSRAVAAKWLWQEVSDLDKEIRAKTLKIDAFRRENGLVQGAKASISSEGLTNVSERLAGAEQAKAQAQAKLDAIRDIKNGGDASVYQSILDNRTVGDIKQQIAIQANQLASSRAILGERHPQRQMQEASLTLLQQQLKAEISRISAGAQKDYETASSLVVSLKEQLVQAKNEAFNALADESSVEGMVRDVDAKRQLYAQLYQRASDLEAERRSLSGGARLVSLAEMPVKPNFPKKVPMTAAGFALGLFLAAASCVLRDKLRYEADAEMEDSSSEEEVDMEAERLRQPEVDTPRTVRTREQPDGLADGRRSEEPSSSFRLKIIGTLPNLPTFGSRNNADEKLLSVLRRGMLSVGFKRELKVLATDLFDAGMGRPMLVMPTNRNSRSAAFLTLAIGRELAGRGLNVLAIECASASPEFVTAFQLPDDQPTLSDMLTGASTFASGVARTHIPNLHVVAGDDASFALLESGSAKGLKNLIAWAQTYDFVLLSGPPLLDNRSLRALQVFSYVGVNAVISVERDEPYARALAEAGSRLDRLGLRDLGAVLMPFLSTAESGVLSRDRHERNA